MNRNLKAYPDSSILAQAATEYIIEVGNTSIQTKGKFSLALAGGSTPNTTYQLLASEAFSSQIDWSSTYIFWGDERCVPPEHQDSNYRMAREVFLNHVPLPESNIYRMEGELTPTESATCYEERLVAFFDGIPAFDLILLGMGTDGHTASLFPGTAAIHEDKRWVVAHYIQKLASWRITLTPAAINQAKNIAFIVSGADKAKPIKQVLDGKFQPDLYPSQIIRPVKGKLTWLVDQSAASLLDP